MEMQHWPAWLRKPSCIGVAARREPEPQQHRWRCCFFYVPPRTGFPFSSPLTSPSKEKLKTPRGSSAGTEGKAGRRAGSHLSSSAETWASELLLSLLFSAPGRGGDSSGSVWALLPRGNLPCHPQPLLGRVARLWLQPTLQARASVPFKGKPDQIWSGSLEFMAKRSRMNFHPTSRCYNSRQYRALGRTRTHPAKEFSCFWSFYSLVYRRNRLCFTSTHCL